MSNNKNEESNEESDEEMNFVNKLVDLNEEDSHEEILRKILDAFPNIISKVIQLRVERDGLIEDFNFAKEKYKELLTKYKNNEQLIKELTNKLNNKQRKHINKDPKRSLTTGEKNQLLAIYDHKCANKPDSDFEKKYNYKCNLWKINSGTFDLSGFEFDHKEDHAKGGKTTLQNCQPLCPACHSVKSKFPKIGKKDK